MDFELPDDADPRRIAVREWLANHLEPTMQDMADAGYVAPHLPEPWGLGADPIHQVIIEQELDGVIPVWPARELPDGPLWVAIRWAAPTILMAGTEEQKARYLPKIFNREEFWCQLFSEPDVGSDLANVTTRAVRDGDEYVVNGSKIWSSGAHGSNFGILLARTDPDVPKHKGISYFICPMDTPGITVTPINDMTTAHSFNQVFFDDVRLHRSMMIGTEGDGWKLAKATLVNERVSLSGGGAIYGEGPSTYELVDLLRRSGGVDDPVMRDRATRLYCNAEVLRLIRLRTLSARINGGDMWTAAAVQKVLADEHGQELMELAKDMAGAAGMLEGSGPAGDLDPTLHKVATEVNFPRGEGSQFPEVDPLWHYGFLFAPALTIGGGTWAVQRNIIGESILGLPREPDPNRDKTWAEAQLSTN